MPEPTASGPSFDHAAFTKVPVQVLNCAAFTGSCRGAWFSPRGARRHAVSDRKMTDAHPINFIFDVEGTLVDCTAQVLNCWMIVLKNWGVSVPPEKLATYSGMDPEDMLEKLVPALADKDRKSLIAEHEQEYHNAFLPSVRAFPHVRELFKALKQRGHRIGLGTTCDRKELGHYRRLMDADDCIDVVACGEDVKKGKPHPDLFKLAVSRFPAGGTPLAIGDTPYDAEAARRIGIEAIGVLTGGFSEAVLREAQCGAVFRDPGDLLTGLHEGRLTFIGAINRLHPTD
jgi:HAD superfamily hydrolase (TIGR01549 family)